MKNITSRQVTDSILSLFNCVAAKNGGNYSFLPNSGVLVEPSASHCLDYIKEYYLSVLTASDFNKTFHKSWAKVIKSSRENLAIDQILHYMTTYGTAHTGEYIYIPAETLNIPNDLRVMVVKGVDEEELKNKCFGLLSSGVALKQDTIHHLVNIIDGFGWDVDPNKIKNKEAMMVFCKKLGIIPSDAVEKLRYMVYLATESALLIKSKEVLDGICSKGYVVKNVFLQVPNEDFAPIFNRFKPIFISIKKGCPQLSSKINKISKMSKKMHKPLSVNILNNVGNVELVELIENRGNLLDANFFQLARILNYLTQYNNPNKVYTIRNGKGWAKESGKTQDVSGKIDFILSILREKFDLSGQKFYIPDYVKYAMPTSEKNFVGNIPSGTKFSTKERIGAGVYWRNDWGATDIDLSGIGVGKVGWNARYNSDGVSYSGDMTDARDGAVEYISCDKTHHNILLTANIYNGEPNSKAKIVLGKGDEIDKNYMMNPNNVWLQADFTFVKKESVVGLMYSDEQNHFIVLNIGVGNKSISGGDDITINFRKAIFQKWTNCFYLNDLIEFCGGKLCNNGVDLSPDKLEKDSLLKIFQ